MSGPTITLSNGVKMPAVGLGTFLASEGDCEQAVRNALDAGYRLIDTAFLYQNEGIIGDVIAEYIADGRLKREDIFITTKAWAHQVSPDSIEAALRSSLEKLKTDYVDLYLAHGPASFTPDQLPRKDVKVEEIWKGLEKLYRQGLARSIGVSNWSNDQIKRAMKIANVPIHVSQVELHLYFPQKEHRSMCRRNGIAITSYGTFGSPGRHVVDANGGNLFENSRGAANELNDSNVLELAYKYSKTPAQILLRHMLQSGVAVIPKSVTPARVHQNFDIFDFELTPEDIILLESHDKKILRLFEMEPWSCHPEDPYASERKKKKSNLIM